ncbi:MAG: hypothetical protein ABR907_12840 [Terracidiphilus sp.]|jgi:hypothetical protein
MDAFQDERARRLVGELEREGKHSGLLVLKGAVVLRCSGAPYTDFPIPLFDETDLRNAVELDLLEKQKILGDPEWEWWVVKKLRQ